MSCKIDEGYLFIDQFDRRDVSVFKYQLNMFKKANDVYRGIHMQFLEAVGKSIGRTFERIKLDMIKKYKQLPNPATYLVSASLHFPFEETLLPVTKRLFIHHINTIKH